MREWVSSSVETGGDVVVVVVVVVGCMVGPVGLEHSKSCSSCFGCRFCRCCWSLLSQSAIAHSALQGCRRLNSIVHYTCFFHLKRYYTCSLVSFQLLLNANNISYFCSLNGVRVFLSNVVLIVVLRYVWYNEQKAANCFEAQSELHAFSSRSHSRHCDNPDRPHKPPLLYSTQTTQSERGAPSTVPPLSAQNAPPHPLS